MSKNCFSFFRFSFIFSLLNISLKNFIIAACLALSFMMLQSSLNIAIAAEQGERKSAKEKKAEKKSKKKSAADSIRDLQALIDDQSKPALMTPGEPKWKPAPLPLPKGAELTVLEGDPNQPGPFLMRIKYPANYILPAHWSLSDEHITVISGVLHLGIGDRLEEDRAKIMPAGSFARIPAKTNHYSFAMEETVVQYHGVGPWGIEYINPEETPDGIKGLTGMNGKLSGESKDEQTSYITSPGALELRGPSDLEALTPPANLGGVSNGDVATGNVKLRGNDGMARTDASRGSANDANAFDASNGEVSGNGDVRIMTEESAARKYKRVK